MKQDPSSETDNCSAGQEISRISRKVILSAFRQNLLLDSFLTQIFAQYTLNSNLTLPYSVISIKSTEQYISCWYWH